MVISNNNQGTCFADTNSNKSIWYPDANNLYGYAMMHKIPYKYFKYIDTSLVPRSVFLDTVLNTPDDSGHGYYIDCDINYTNSCKDGTEQLALMLNKRKIIDKEF